MILLDKITKKISQIVTLFPHNGKLPDFSYKLPHFKCLDVLSIYPNNVWKKIILTASFGIEVLIQTIVSVPC